MRLEALNTTFRGHRTLVIGSTELALSRYSLLEASTMYKGKDILVIQEGQDVAIGNPLLFRKRWDCIFRIKNSFELQILSTYVTNAPKPVRIFWTCVGNSGDIPRALWSKWSTLDISLLGYSESAMIGGCEWEIILFQMGHPINKVEKVLSARGSGIVALLKDLKEHWDELIESKAGVAWTSATNSLYWYDPSEYVYDAPLYTKEEASTLLKSIGKWLE